MKVVEADKIIEKIVRNCPFEIDTKSYDSIWDIPIVEAIPIKQLLSILPMYNDYIHTKTYLHNETMEDIYSKGHEEGWNACLRAIEEELVYWEKEEENSN